MKSLLNLGDVGRGWTMKLCLTAAVALGLGFTGCSASYVNGSDAPVNVYIAAINSGRVLSSDVRLGATSNVICSDTVPVAVAVRNKNPNGALDLASHVIFKSYEVRFFRTDGRGVEGTDVPYRITGNLAAEVDVASSGTSNIPIEVVRIQAKLEPPLSTINQATVLTAMAEITLYGETISGKAVSASGRFQIDFADYGDTASACPVAS